MEMDDLTKVLASFEKEGLEYILVGGTALNLHGIIRATEDIDIFVRPDPENIERLRKALDAVFQDPAIQEISTEDLCGSYPAIRYYPPAGSLFLDILTRLGEFASYEDLESQEIDLQGIRVRVASPKALFWLKRGTVRAIDRADAEMLREVQPRGMKDFFMPIKRFHSVAEMSRIPPCEPLSEDCFARIARLWSRSSSLSPRVYPRGVFKFKSLEEAQVARDQVTKDNIRRLAKERSDLPSRV